MRTCQSSGMTAATQLQWKSSHVQESQVYWLEWSHKVGLSQNTVRGHQGRIWLTLAIHSKPSTSPENLAHECPNVLADPANELAMDAVVHADSPVRGRASLVDFRWHPKNGST